MDRGVSFGSGPADSTASEAGNHRGLRAASARWRRGCELNQKPTLGPIPDGHQHDSAWRRAEYQRNPRLEALLVELKTLLAPIGPKLTADHQMPRWPVLFIIGPPRSGTTLLLQFLHAAGVFATPSNLISRFYFAPALGARLQRLIFDSAFDYRGEMANAGFAWTLESELGRTQGPLQPNEMLHFWRRFVPNYDPESLSATSIAAVDTAAIAAELAALEAVLEKPLAMKGGLLQSSLATLDACAQPALFVALRRDPLYIAQSLLLARERHYGRRVLWWSYRPTQYEQLRALDAFHQVAGQAHYASKLLDEQLALIPPDRWLALEYAEFCAAPQVAYRAIVDLYRTRGIDLPPIHPGPLPAPARDIQQLSAADFSALRAAMDDFIDRRIE